MDPPNHNLQAPSLMNISVLSQRLLDGNYLDPAKIGPKHLLFEKKNTGNLIGELIEPTRPEVKLWEGGVDALMSAFQEWRKGEPFWTFGVMEPDCCFDMIVWPHEIDDWQRFTKGTLSWLQTGETSDDPIVQIVVATERLDWLLVFERRVGLEIAFYGSEHDWLCLSRHLIRG